MGEEERRNAARTLAEEAQRAFDARNYVRAEQVFRDAEKLFAAPTITLQLARSQAAQGKLVAASENCNKVIRDWGSNAAAPPAFKAAVEAARSEYDKLQPRIGAVLLTVEGGAAPSVTVDEKVVLPAMLGIKRQSDPGPHVARATAQGYKTAEASFTLQEGETKEIKLVLVKDPSFVALPPPPRTTPAARETREPPAVADTKKGSSRTLALAAFGVGGAGLVVGGVTGVIAMGKASDLNGRCPGGACPSSEDAAVSSYKTMGTISTVGFVVGGVGVAAGAVLLLTSPKSTAHVSPYVGFGTLGATGTF